MSTHVEWAEAAISGAAYLPAVDVNPCAEGDDLPVLVLGVLGDTVMAFSGSKDEIVKLLLDGLNAVGADEVLPGLRERRLKVSPSPGGGTGPSLQTEALDVCDPSRDGRRQVSG